MPPFQLHPLAIAGLGAMVAAHRLIVSDPRCRRRFAAAVVLLAAVILWPVGDVAASVSLSVATSQRLVIMLPVASLMVRSFPTVTLVRLTRSAPADYVTRRIAHPALAMMLVTAVGSFTLTTAVVDAGARLAWVRGLTLVAVLMSGIVLWIPALGVMPGAKRLSPIGRAGFIFVASLVVTSLSIIWIFARHSLYPALHGQITLLHVTPLLDQQIAGFVAKFGSYIPMWAVSFTIFSRADNSGESPDESPLHWADVERHLLRIERQRARLLRRQTP